MIVFAGREYRPAREELERLAEDLERRAETHGAIFRRRDDDTFGPLAARIRDAAGPPKSVVELESHEAAALLLSTMTAGAESPELKRFANDYVSENEWTQRPFSNIFNSTKRVGPLLALQIGRWFFEDGLETPIGGLDQNGEDLPPSDVDFAALAGANSGFADVASAWARFNGTLTEQSLRVDEMLRWLRREREEATADADNVDEVERARAGARAWALREAALWLEAAANRSRAPWDPPRHEA
jgi:hypothetical protein